MKTQLGDLIVAQNTFTTQSDCGDATGMPSMSGGHPVAVTVGADFGAGKPFWVLASYDPAVRLDRNAALQLARGWRSAINRLIQAYAVEAMGLARSEWPCDSYILKIQELDRARPQVQPKIHEVSAADVEAMFLSARTKVCTCGNHNDRRFEFPEMHSDWCREDNA